MAQTQDLISIPTSQTRFIRRALPFTLSLLLLSAATVGQTSTADLPNSKDASTNELIVYGIRPASYIRWEWSPNIFIWDGLMALLNKRLKHLDHPVGHASVEVTCAADTKSGTPAAHFHSAMTTLTHDGGERELLAKGAGLGAFLEPMPGKLETTEDLKANIELNESRIRYLRFKLNSQTCRRLVQYFHDIQTKLVPDETGKLSRIIDNYGFPSRPRNQQGAACTSYAYSYLDAAGLYPSEMQNAFSRKVRIPLKAIGRYTAEKFFKGTEDESKIVDHVSMFQLPSIADRWAFKDEPGVNYTARDVEFMSTWIDQVRLNPSLQSSFAFQPESKGKMLGLYADVSAKPAPQEPIFLPQLDLEQYRKSLIAKQPCRECEAQRLVEQSSGRDVGGR